MNIYNPSLPVPIDLGGKIWTSLKSLKSVQYLWTYCRETEYLAIMSKGAFTKGLKFMFKLSGTLVFHSALVWWTRIESLTILHSSTGCPLLYSNHTKWMVKFYY